MKNGALLKLKVIYEDDDLLAIDKPAGITVFSEGKSEPADVTLIDAILKKYPEIKNVGENPRYGIVHRLDKNTSGIILVAENNKILSFLQKQFEERKTDKKYLALVAGKFTNTDGTIETLLGREPKNRIKQKVYSPCGPDAEKKGLRKAKTYYKVLKQYFDGKNHYTLVEASPKTGRKHQIRVHLASLGHPIIGDKMYGFKNQPCLEGLKRQFLHASRLKIKISDKEEKEFYSELPRGLKIVLEKLKLKQKN